MSRGVFFHHSFIYFFKAKYWKYMKSSKGILYVDVRVWSKVAKITVLDWLEWRSLSISATLGAELVLPCLYLSSHGPCDRIWCINWLKFKLRSNRPFATNGSGYTVLVQNPSCLVDGKKNVTASKTMWFWPVKHSWLFFVLLCSKA